MTDSEFKVLLAVLSLSGGILGAILKTFWDRRAEKKKPKTTTRAEAYEEFVAFFLAAEPPAARADQLARIKARIMVFGESGVVEAVGKFLSELDVTCGSDASTLSRLVPVIKAMRKSLLTGHRRVIPVIEQLLEFQARSNQQLQRTGEDAGR